MSGWSQQFKKLDRDIVQAMLRDADSDIRKNYYDPKLHGLDWDARVRTAKGNIDKADSEDSAVSEVAALLDSLNDSHTSFTVPTRTYKQDYGFNLKMIGERCYVVGVTPSSDAEKKGLKNRGRNSGVRQPPGFAFDLWRIRYIYGELRPQAGLRLTLRGEYGETRDLDVMAKHEPSSVLKYNLNLGVNQKVRDKDDAYGVFVPQFFEKGEALVVVRIPAFAMLATEVDLVVGRMRKHQGAVLDLRGNPGGFVKTVDRILGQCSKMTLRFSIASVARRRLPFL